MTWFTPEYRAIYDQVATGNGLTPAPLTDAQNLIGSVDSSQSLLDTAQPDITPATYDALTLSLSSTLGGLGTMEGHITTQVANFTRYSAAARIAQVVTEGGCSTIFGAMTGALDSILTVIGDTLATLDGLVQDVIDGVAGAVAALDAALGGIVSEFSSAVGSISITIANELAELGQAISTSLNLGDTMGIVQEFLNNPCARAIVEQSGSTELLTALEALE